MAGDFIPFAPESMMWRINRERVVLLAGPAAAVLQVAHPQVAMGVAAHSIFRTNSIGRLHRTLEAVYSVAFGTSDEVERVRDGVARAQLRDALAPEPVADPESILFYTHGSEERGGARIQEAPVRFVALEDGRGMQRSYASGEAVLHGLRLARYGTQGFRIRIMSARFPQES